VGDDGCGTPRGMVESRMRRQPPTPVKDVSIGRGGTSQTGDDQFRRADEESVREEHSHLRAGVANLRREGAEARERLRAADRKLATADKLLQDLLASATGASGVPGEALDQLREDLQALLQVKKRAQEARNQLEEKEQKIQAIMHELRSSCVSSMTYDVSAAKSEAKAKAMEWAKVSATSASAQQQKRAKDLFEQMTKVEREISKAQQDIVMLQDKRNKLEGTVSSHGGQIEKLRDKRKEIQQQMEQCQERIDSLSGVAERHVVLRQECDACFEDVRKARQEGLALKLKNASASRSSSANSASWEVNAKLFAPGFRPLRQGADTKAEILLSRFRLATGLGRISALEVLAAEDADGDGRVSTQELAHALQQLQIPGSDSLAVQRLVGALSDGLAPGADGLVSIVDFALALQLQPPRASLSDTELWEACESLAWACRRRGITEVELRSRMAAWLADPNANLANEVGSFCGQLGLESAVALVLGEGLEVRREQFGVFVPSWRCLTSRSQVSELLRFARDLAVRGRVAATAAAPLLAVSDCLSFEAFLEAGSLLGPTWCREDLEHVALLAEAGAGAGAPRTGAPPAVDGARLARAATPGGFATEFPEAARDALPDALAVVEAAAVAATRRTGAAAPGHARPSSARSAASSRSRSGERAAPGHSQVSTATGAQAATTAPAGQEPFQAEAAPAAASKEDSYGDEDSFEAESYGGDDFAEDSDEVDVEDED